MEMAVSYTHLDVYKRQRLNIAAATTISTIVYPPAKELLNLFLGSWPVIPYRPRTSRFLRPYLILCQHLLHFFRSHPEPKLKLLTGRLPCIFLNHSCRLISKTLQDVYKRQQLGTWYMSVCSPKN